jgi:signal transduction histidine kinase
MSGSGAVAERIAAGPAPGDGAAVRAERQRFARDLHDSVTQTLIGLQLSAQAAADLWDTQPAQAREALDLVRRLAAAASTELRTLLLDLRDAVLVRQGLSAALAAHCAVVRRASGLQVDLHLAGRATRAAITLVQEATVRLVVEDDGVGFGAPAPAFSYGLAGMRERVAALDGRLQLETRPGGGARVVAELPLPAATAGPADAGAWGV